MDSEILYKQALAAVYKVFNDTSVSQEETVRSLKDIRNEIDLIIDVLEADVKDNNEDQADN